VSTVEAQSRRNGVEVARLFATLDAVKAQPEAAGFRFGVDNRWISGTHNRNQISTFYGVGAEQQHESTFAVEAGHPRGAGRRGRRAVIRGDGTVALEGAAICHTMAITPDTHATAQPNVSRFTHQKATR
jgi:hypothetical protein